MILLSLDEIVVLARRVVPNVQFRDLGLLHGAAARPLATIEERELYPHDLLKMAALVHSVIRSHALIDGNKRLGLASLLVTLRMNDMRSTMSNDEAYDFIMAIVDRTLDDVDAIADRIGASIERVASRGVAVTTSRRGRGRDPER